MGAHWQVKMGREDTGQSATVTVAGDRHRCTHRQPPLTLMADSDSDSGVYESATGTYGIGYTPSLWISWHEPAL